PLPNSPTADTHGCGDHGDAGHEGHDHAGHDPAPGAHDHDHDDAPPAAYGDGRVPADPADKGEEAGDKPKKLDAKARREAQRVGRDKIAGEADQKEPAAAKS